MSKIPLIVIAGATASGKTALAVELALRLGGEVVSADSMQIYREISVGTAKPDTAEMRGVPHHMLDFLPPEENYSVAEYVNAAHGVIAGICARGRTAVVAGGTGLYIDSLVRDVDFDGEDAPDIRAALEERARREGAQALLAELAEFDSVSAQRLHLNNLKRIIRAIEFYRLHGVPISEHQERTRQKDSRYRAIYMMIDRPRAELYERINLRVELMMENGLLEEARALYEKRDARGKTAAQAIGYKELFAYFDGGTTLADAVEEIKLRSRQYAKRQLTWFRRNPDMHLLSPGNAADEAETLARKFLSE